MLKSSNEVKNNCMKVTKYFLTESEVSNGDLAVLTERLRGQYGKAQV